MSQNPHEMILVGDPHATAASIPELNNIVDLLLELSPPRVVFLGDLFHTHQIVHLSVLEFWRASMSRLVAAGIEVVALVGNHDMSTGHNNTVHALNSLRDLNITIVDAPKIIGPNIVAMPYYSNDEFLKAASALDGELLICHQTFEGAKYENGFYAPNAVDAELVRASKIISGHIHTGAEFGKVWYPGTPRWMTVNDANVDKGIWKVSWDGTIYTKDFISTSRICQPVEVLMWKEGEDAPKPRHTNAKVTYDLFGKKEFLDLAQAQVRAIGGNYRLHQEGTSAASVNEAKGASESWVSFLSSYKSQRNTPPEVLRTKFEEILGLS